MKPLNYNNKVSTQPQRVYTRAYPDGYATARDTTPPKVGKEAKRKTMIRRKLEERQEQRALEEQLGF